MPDSRRFFGKHRGEVVDDRDPLGSGRVQVRAPSVLVDVAAWAMPCVPYAGEGTPTPIPPVGTPVWVEFEAGDPAHPIWTGCLQVASEPVEGERPRPLEPWTRAFGDRLSEDHLGRLAATFRLEAEEIAALGRAPLQGSADERFARVWSQCRRVGRDTLGALADWIEPGVDPDALVLPQGHREVLEAIARRIRYRHVVFGRWRVPHLDHRGGGPVALFSGPGGTGKSLAAEALAYALEVPLLRVDLGRLVSTYIGETEKNLNRLLYSAARCGAVLLFDEADALFGRGRGDDGQPHRGLLRHLRRHHGLTVITTSQPEGLGEAWRRQVDYALEFPFPDQRDRGELWRRALPEGAPYVGTLDFEALTRLRLSGGEVREVALAAAFLAAEANRPVTMDDLRRAAIAVSRAQGRPLTGAERWW